jgi:hypothetical protein
MTGIRSLPTVKIVPKGIVGVYIDQAIFAIKLSLWPLVRKAVSSILLPFEKYKFEGFFSHFDTKTDLPELQVND